MHICKLHVPIVPVERPRQPYAQENAGYCILLYCYIGTWRAWSFNLELTRGLPINDPWCHESTTVEFENFSKFEITDNDVVSTETRCVICECDNVRRPSGKGLQSEWDDAEISGTASGKGYGKGSSVEESTTMAILCYKSIFWYREQSIYAWNDILDVNYLQVFPKDVLRRSMGRFSHPMILKIRGRRLHAYDINRISTVRQAFAVCIFNVFPGRTFKNGGMLIADWRSDGGLTA